MLQYSIGSRIQEERKALHETGKKEREEKIMANVYVFTADGFEEIEGLTVVDLMSRSPGTDGFHQQRAGCKRQPWD